MARLAVGMLAILAATGCSTQPEVCDRDCLLALTDNYVAGLAANDPSGLPLADDLILVEDLKRTPLGEGLWQTITGGPTGFSIHVPDPGQQTAGWMGMMVKGGQPVMVALRLKLEGGEVVEAEHLTTPISPENLARVQVPRPGLVSEVSALERLGHDRLIEIGASYYDAVDENDGSLMPFADDCQRHENGFVAAGVGANTIVPEEGRPAVATGCAAQLDSGAMTYIDRIENRRMVAADPVTGLVMGFSQFRHPFDNLPYEVTLSDGTRAERNADNMPYDPFDMPAAHIFKIGRDGKVHEIEAIGFVAPYDSPTGWE